MSVLITKAEFDQGMGEQVENIKDLMGVVNQLKNAINTQAHVLGLHRYILERFVPLPLLEQATKDYKEQIEQQILVEAQVASGKAN